MRRGSSGSTPCACAFGADDDFTRVNCLAIPPRAAQAARLVGTGRPERQLGASGLYLAFLLANPGCATAESPTGDFAAPGSADAGAAGRAADAANATRDGAAGVDAISIFTAKISASGLAAGVPDNGYQGNHVGGACVDAFLSANESALAVRLSVGIEHSAVGDLVIHLIGPDGTVSALLSRPGFSETADTGADGMGDQSNLSAAAPIRFADGSSITAELMGAGLDGLGTVCADDLKCEFAPSPGAASGAGLADLVGVPATGTWRICVADANPGNTGIFDSFALEIDVESLL